MRKRWRILIGALVIVALLWAWLMFRLFGPSTRIVVSPQTTIITAPLGPDGLPDYVAASMAATREGVIPKNNAAVLLLQAMGPVAMTEDEYQRRLAMLGASPSDGKPLQETVREIAARFEALANVDEVTGQSEYDKDELERRARSYPWRSTQLPAVAESLRENAEGLELLREASSRSKYYGPWEVSPGEGLSPVMTVVLYDRVIVKEAVRILALDALLAIGEGDADSAWASALAGARLSHLVTQDHGMVNDVIGFAMSHESIRPMLAVLGHPADSKTVRRRQSEISQAPRYRAVVESMRRVEHFTLPDIACFVANGNKLVDFGTVGPAGAGDVPDPTNGGRIYALDWNRVLETCVDQTSRLTDVLAIEDRTERWGKLQECFRDLAAAVDASAAPGSFAWLTSRRARSESIALRMTEHFHSPLVSVVRAEDRANARLDLVRVAAALAVYRAERGEYPASLEALSPAILEEPLLDPYSEEPFRYERRGEGYLLYSVYLNGEDDGGTDDSGEIVAGEWAGEPADVAEHESDLVIRLPLPVFELPAASPE